MTENDNQLIEQLFSGAARQEIADDGFTERVMQRIAEVEVAGRRQAAAVSPSASFLVSHSSSLIRLWTLLCVATGVALFFLLDGWLSLRNSLLAILETGLTWLSVLVTTAPTADLRLDPALLLLLLAFVLVVLPYQTARRLSTAL